MNKRICFGKADVESKQGVKTTFPVGVKVQRTADHPTICIYVYISYKYVLYIMYHIINILYTYYIYYIYYIIYIYIIYTIYILYYIYYTIYILYYIYIIASSAGSFGSFFRDFTFRAPQTVLKSVSFRRDSSVDVEARERQKSAKEKG